MGVEGTWGIMTWGIALLSPRLSSRSPLGTRGLGGDYPFGFRERSLREVGSLGLEPRTNGLKVRCSTD